MSFAMTLTIQATMAIAIVHTRKPSVVVPVAFVIACQDRTNKLTKCCIAVCIITTLFAGIVHLHYRVSNPHFSTDFNPRCGGTPRPLKAGVGLAAQELAGAGAADEFAGVDDGAAAGEDGFGRALDADAFKHGIVHAHVMGFGADDFFVIGIEDDQVGVGADGDGAFARVEAEELCGRGCNELDKTVRRKMLAVDSAGIHKTQAVLDAGAAVGDFGEIVLAELFLLLEAEGAVVGGDDLKSVFGEALPEFFLVPLFAERRSEDVLRAFKSGGIHIFEREIQVLRAGFRVGGEAAVARFADFFESVVAGEMDD